MGFGIFWAFLALGMNRDKQHFLRRKLLSLKGSKNSTNSVDQVFENVYVHI